MQGISKRQCGFGCLILRARRHSLRTAWASPLAYVRSSGHPFAHHWDRREFRDFSVVNALLLRPLPCSDPDRLAVLWLRSPGINIPQDWPSPGHFIDIQSENHSIEEMSISHGGTGTLLGLDQPERVEVLQTSSALFHLLGAKPLYGRLLLPGDDKPGARRGGGPQP